MRHIEHPVSHLVIISLYFIFKMGYLYSNILMHEYFNSNTITHLLRFPTDERKWNCSLFHDEMHTCSNAIYFFFYIIISPRQHFCPHFKRFKVFKGNKCSVYCVLLAFFLIFSLYFTIIKYCHIQYTQFIPFLLCRFPNLSSRFRN